MYLGEQQRVAELKRISILDTSAEPVFDRAVQRISELTGCPIALVSFVDSNRQWFKARIGLDVSEMAREASFCSHAIKYWGRFEVCDARHDRRFRSNPLVTGPMQVRYYAGVPLATARGARIGALCVLDRQVRPPMSDSVWQCFWSNARVLVSALEEAARSKSHH